MIDKLAKFVNLKAFACGFISALILLSCLSYTLSKGNIFKTFSRFHRYVTNETLFYPTARQVNALVHEKSSPEKVVVIISGSSVMRGNGQSRQTLWSDALQQQLGNDFQVINLALNGGGPAGIGMYAAEQLMKESRKVILVADLSIVGIGISPDNGSVYRSMYFDAESRDFGMHFAERAMKVQQITRQQSVDKYHEYMLQSMMNSYLNFEELWSYVGYRYLFTVWTPLAASNPWSPRDSYGDTEADCDPAAGYKNFLKEEMDIMRGFANAKLLGREIGAAIEYSIPARFVPNVLFAINLYSPHYLERMNDIDRSHYYENFHGAARVLVDMGFNAITLEKDLNESDFCDRAHFTARGGKKIAVNLAPKIVALAKDRGYLQ